MTVNIKELVISEINGLQKSDGPLHKNNLKTSIAIVLLRTAAVDFNYSNQELEAIIEIFSKNMKISPDDSKELLEVALGITKDKKVVDECIGVLKDRLNTEQKQTVLAMVWKIIHADQNVDQNERDLAFQISEQLGMSVEDGVEARRMVMEGEV